MFSLFFALCFSFFKLSSNHYGMSYFVTLLFCCNLIRPRPCFDTDSFALPNSYFIQLFAIQRNQLTTHMFEYIFTIPCSNLLHKTAFTFPKLCSRLIKIEQHFVNFENTGYMSSTDLISLYLASLNLQVTILTDL